jgi:ParB-like chromosome segregation protein Spo0J
MTNGSARNQTSKGPQEPLAVVEVSIDDLRPDPANPRRISDAQIEALTRSLQQFGFVQPVLARSEDKTAIGGHQRLVAARRLGYRTVPTVFLDITLEQARLLNLGLNKISGDWDNELLARLLSDLSTEEVDLSLSGFDDDEVSKLLKSLEQRENGSASSRSTSKRRWRPHRRHHAPNVAISGRWATTACSAATPATRRT